MAHQRGEARPTSKLKVPDVIEMRRMHAAGARLHDIHFKFADKCSKPNVHHIVTGKRWKYLLKNKES